MNRLKTDESFRTLCLTAFSGAFLAADFFRWLPGLPFSPAWVAVLLCGAPIVFGAVRGLVTEFDVTADVLVAIALTAALLLGQYFAAGEVAFIMQLGKVLEDETAAKSHKSLQALIRLTPQTACVRTPEGEKIIAADDVKPGDILLVRPGQTVPADGTIRSGTALIGQSVMTGESIPVTKGVGDEVYQGTVNQQGAVEVEAVGAGDDSSLKKMVRLVREAEEKKAPIVRLADRWARILVPVALGCAALILLMTRNMTRAVTALVVFCPCSLILAAPTAVMAAIGNATKRGVLIKSGEAVEAAASLDTLAMDKTGTLTEGKPQVSEIRFLDRDMDEKELLPLIAGAEKFSEHPLGRAVLEYCRKRGADAPDPREFDARAGMGVSALVLGRRVLIGEKMTGSGPQEGLAEEEAARMRGRGVTVLPVSVDGSLRVLVGVADVLRENAGDVVRELKSCGISRIVMMTGDSPETARSIARQAGIGEVRAACLPADKAERIRELQEEGRSVGMIGDGVNDAPALAAARLGIAMGAIGSDLAVETSDIALMSDDLGRLPFLFRLCRKTKKRIRFNIAFSMTLNFAAILLSGFGMLNPVTAALVHNCGSVFVVLNSALLLTYRDKTGYDGRKRGKG